MLDADPKIGVVGGRYLVVDQNRNERYVRMTPTSHAEIIPAMARAIPMANTIAMFRKRVWTEAGGYPDVAELEDQLLWLEAASRSNAAQPSRAA